MTSRMKLCVGLMVLFLVCGNISVARAAPAAGTHAVAALDADTISKLPPFVDANKKIAARWKELTKQLEQERKTKHLKPADLQARWKQMQAQLDSLRTSLLRPLNQRVTNAIGAIAKDRHLSAVIDKRIVLVGMPDITQDVVQKFNQNAGTPAPPPSDSSIGYVNQSKIRSLKGFRDAETQLVAYYSNLSKQLAATAKKDPKQKARLGREIAARLRDKKQALYGPLETKVHAAMDGVVSGGGVSLVLDKREVLWGGRDVTPQVISQLNRSGFLTGQAGR